MVAAVISLAIAGGILLLVWVADCWRRPYIECRHCAGEKRNWDASHEHFGMTFCLWCGNAGFRLRWELRLLSVPF